jgi:hypothetical protein
MGNELVRIGRALDEDGVGTVVLQRLAQATCGTRAVVSYAEELGVQGSGLRVEG